MRNSQKHRASAYILAKALAVFLFAVLALGITTFGAVIIDLPSTVAYAEEAIDIADATIEIEDQTYTGDELTPAVTVMLDDVTLEEGVDFTVKYENNIDYGVGRAIVSGTGIYTGSVTKIFLIAARDIDEATITVASVTHTGFSVTPDVTVKFNGRTLTKGIDYVVTYYNNVNVGSYADVYVEGRGNFTGGQSEYFTIKPHPQGWDKYNGTWYYYGASGTMVKNGWANYGSYWFYLGSNGKAVTSTWIQSGNKWYYLGSDGVMVTNGWVKSGGKYYYMGSSGAMLTNSWVKYAGKYYYLGGSGTPLVSSWVQSGGKWYYLGASGAMLTSQWVGNYWVGADGAYDASKTKGSGSGGGSSSGGGSGYYILNTNSKVFHKPGCGTANKISAKNKSTYTGSRSSLISMGYKPCGNCNP